MSLGSLPDRRAWLSVLERIAAPVLAAFAAGELRRRMPLRGADVASGQRDETAPLEAIGRLLAGLGPWLACSGGDAAECHLRATMQAQILAGLEQALDPANPAWLGFDRHQQTLVDAAFLAQGLQRAGSSLLDGLSAAGRGHLLAALACLRDRRPGFNNWLLFAAMTEALLARLGAAFDGMRIDYALRQHEQWYLGDGHYGDGPAFHCDYYNSFVIHPFLLDIHAALRGRDQGWHKLEAGQRQRAMRFAAVQERMIAPDGSWPPLGRSLVYRCGAFHALAQAALLGHLPAELPPGQVRGALSAAIARSLLAPGTFDDAGWLQIGLAGHQPGLGEGYITTGSLYLCACAFLPLGLPPEHPFWAEAAQPWTACRAWGGEDLPADHALL